MGLIKTTVSTGWSWVTGHVRLLIEYALIAVFVTLAGFAVQQYYHGKGLQEQVDKLNTDVGSLNTSIDQLATVNHQQDEAIQKMRKLREIDSQSITALQTGLSSNKRVSEATRDMLNQLEVTNAAAKEILDMPLDPGLRCMLDRTCPDKGGDKDKGRRPNPT